MVDRGLRGGPAQHGEGFNVGQDDNYESETTINKHYFKINSNGFNVGGNDKTSLETIVSIIY